MSRKESIPVILARLDERMSHFIEENKEDHIDLGKKIDTLCEHVNHQHEDYDKRLKVLEDAKIVLDSKYKGRLELFKWTTIGLTIILGVLAVLDYFNCI